MTRINTSKKIAVTGLGLFLIVVAFGQKTQAGPPKVFKAYKPNTIAPKFQVNKKLTIKKSPQFKAPSKKSSSYKKANVGQILHGIGSIIAASKHPHHYPHPGHPVHPVYPVHPVHPHPGHPVIIPSNTVNIKPAVVPANVVILNPIENQSVIRFAFEGEIKTLKPGFMLDMGREGVIVFDRGRGIGSDRALYTLKDGTYSFRVKNGGLDLVSKTFNVVLDNTQGTSDFLYYHQGKPMTLRAGFLAELSGRHPVAIEYKRNNTDVISKRLTSGTFVVQNTPAGMELAKMTPPAEGSPIVQGPQLSQQPVAQAEPIAID